MAQVRPERGPSPSLQEVPVATSAASSQFASPLVNHVRWFPPILREPALGDVSRRQDAWPLIESAIVWFAPLAESRAGVAKRESQQIGDNIQR